MRRILSCIVSVLLCIPSFSQDDVVVMTVNGYDVSKSEFEYFFEKNNLENNISKKTVREYADLYLNFKLKVQAAIDEGLDKSESFISEYRMYRDMQAEEYLLDKDFLEKVARSSYEQSLAEIGETGLAHISVISAIPDEKNGRTLDDCYERLNTVYDKLNAGESFRRMAYEYSDDDLAQNGGEAGWVSWKQLPQEVSEVVFSLEEGEYSKPFISDGAVFLIMVDERRQLGTYEQNRFDIDNWMRETGVYDESKRKVANEYAARLGWTIRDEEAVAHLDSVLEDVEPEFGNLSREYHDGLLVFDISNHEIWERVANNPEELESYFNANRKKFKFDKPCFKGMVLFCRSEGDFNQIKSILDRTDMSVWVDSILAYNGRDIKVRVLRSPVESGVFRQGQNEYVDKVVFGIGDFKPMAGYPYVNVVGRVLKKPESIQDVSGDVAEDYQNYLEKQWLKRLKSKYKYKINKKALKTVGQNK
ncbi:MAG: peptidylprolyl isomerase [Bacteroidaceae bacterium]|nr:peptidylprolyl isomerase [Bacteroidaceae bacterium]